MKAPTVNITTITLTSITLCLEDMIQAFWENTYELSLEGKNFQPESRYLNNFFSQDIQRIKEVFKDGLTPSVVPVETMEFLEVIDSKDIRFELVIVFKGIVIGTIHGDEVMW